MNNMERNTETLSDIMAEEEPDVVKPAADLLQTVGGSHPDCLMDAQTQNTGCRRDAVRDDHGNAAAESQSVNDKVGVTTSNTTPPIVESEEEKTLFHSVLRQMQQQQKLKPGRRCKKKTLMKMAKLFVIAKEWDSKITETIGMKYSNGPLSEHELQVLNQGEETFTSSVTSQNNTIKTKSLDVGSSDCNRETFIPATSADATFSGQTAEPQVTLKKKSKAKQDCCASTNLLDVPDLNPEISECSRLITSTKVQKKSRNMSSVAFKEDPKITCDNSETARNSLAVISSVDVSETQTSNPTSSVKRRTKQKNLPRTLTEYNAMMPQDGSEGFLLSDVTQKDENEAMCTTAAEIHSEDPPGTQAKNKTGRKKVKMSKAKQFVQDAETTGDNKKSDSCKVEDLSDQQTSPSQVSYIKSSQVSKWRRTRVVKKEPVVKNGNMLDEVLHVQDNDIRPLNEYTHDVKITRNQEEMLNVPKEEQLISDRIEAANPENTNQFKGKKKHLVRRRRPKVAALVQENIKLAGEVQNGLTSPSLHENVPEIIKAKRKRDHSGDHAALLSEDESQMEEMVSDLKNALTVSFEFDCEAPKSTWRHNRGNKLTTKRKSGQTAKKKALMRLSNQKSNEQQPESDKGVFVNQEICNKPKTSCKSGKRKAPAGSDKASKAVNMEDAVPSIDHTANTDLNAVIQEQDGSRISELTSEAESPFQDKISPTKSAVSVGNTKMKTIRERRMNKAVWCPKKKLKQHQICASFESSVSPFSFHPCNSLTDDEVNDLKLKDYDVTQRNDEEEEMTANSNSKHCDPLPQKLKPQKPLKCSFCSRSFRHISAFTVHKRIHTGEKPYRCTTCGKRFAHVSRLKLHSETHDESPAVCCPCCDQKFKSKDELIVHFSSHVKDIKSSNVTEDPHKDVPVTSGQNKPFKCSVCCKEFISRATFKMHGRTHSGKPHSCSVCGKTFHKPSSLNVHEKTHWPVKPYSCSVCCAGFVKLRELKRHSETHSGVEPFSCTRCEKTFGSFALLRSHQASAVCSEKRDSAEGNDIEGFLVSQGVEGQITNCETCGEEYEGASDMRRCSVCCRATGEDRVCTSSLSEIWREPEAPENQANEPLHEDQTSQTSFSSQVETEEMACTSSLSETWKDTEAPQGQASELPHEDQKSQMFFSPQLVPEEEMACTSSLSEMWKKPEATQNLESEPQREDPMVQTSVSPQLETGEDRERGSSLSEILKELEAPENQPSEPSHEDQTSQMSFPPQVETRGEKVCANSLSEIGKETEASKNLESEPQHEDLNSPQLETGEDRTEIFQELEATENQASEPSHEDQKGQTSFPSQAEMGENEVTDMQPPPSPSDSNSSVSDDIDISVLSPNPGGEFSGAGNIQTTGRPSRFHQRSLIQRHCGRYSCGHFGKSFNRWNKLHQRSHRQTIRPFCCSQCDLEFRFLGSYMDHLQEHAARTPYTCPLCPETFTSGENMSAHIFERHKQDDGMKCSTCGKSFSDLRHLKKHKILHKGVNSHLRLPCNVSFSRIRALKTHLKTHRTRLNVPQPRGPVEPFLFPYHCWKCTAAFSSTDLLQAHQVCHFTPGEKMDDPPEDTQQGDERPTRRLPVSNKKHLFRYPHPDRLYVVPVVSLETPVVISDTEEEQSPSITANNTTPAPNTSNIPQTSSVPALREHETRSSHQQLQDQYEDALKELTDGCNSADLEPVYMIHMDKDEFIDDAHICAICNETFTDVSKLHEHYVDHAKLTHKV